MDWKRGLFASAHASYIGVNDTFPSNCSAGRVNSHSFLLSSEHESIKVPANLWWYLSDENGAKPNNLVMCPSNSLARMLAGHDTILLHKKDINEVTEGWIEECHSTGIVYSGCKNGFVVHCNEERVFDDSLHGSLVERVENKWRKVLDCNGFGKEKMEIVSQYSKRAFFLSEMARNLSMTDDINVMNNLIDSLSKELADAMFGGMMNVCKIQTVDTILVLRFEHVLPILSC